MNVGRVRDAAPVVALPAQALNPLSASTEPITMSLPAKVDLAQRSHEQAAHETTKAHQAEQHRVDQAKAVHQAQATTMINVAGVAQVGRIDVYV